MVMMSTGKILCLDSKIYVPDTIVLNPVDNSIYVPEQQPVELFCGAQTQLADGRILFVGGGGANPFFAHNEAHVFTPTGPAGNEWTDADPIPDEGLTTDERWYATATTLGSGRVLVTAGRTQGTQCDDIPTLQDRPLIFDPNASAGSQWTRLSSSASKVVHYYPFMFQLSDQTVLMAGGAYFTPTGDPTIHLDNYVLHPVLGQWLGGAVARADAPGGSAVMYRPDKVMKAGAGIACGTLASTSHVERLEVVLGTAPNWEAGPSMANARTHFYLIALPDGRVLAVGGKDQNSLDVLTPEWIDPEKKPWPQWQTLAAMIRSRNYHSSAVLCPDARIFIAGEGALGGNTSHENGQFFRPPYLFNASNTFIENSNERPVIDASLTPGTITYQSLFYIYLDPNHPHDVATNWKVSLVRLGASTHSFDQNQRFQWLSFIPEPQLDRLRVSAPVQPNIAPPGYYMLFVLKPGDRLGIMFPSRARIVKLE